MYKNIVNKILDWMAIIFLVGSLYIYIFEKEDFTWQTLFGTDGLTFFGIIVTLFTMLLPKIPFVKRGIGWFLLTFNISQIDYSFEVIVEAPQNVALKELKDSFFNSIDSNDRIKSNLSDPIRNSDIFYKVYHRGLGTNFSIKKNPDFNNSEDFYEDEEPQLHQWRIKNDGVTSFRILERNIKFFLTSYLEHLSHNRVLPNQLVLKISKKNTEINLVDKGILIDSKKYKVERSNIDISASNTNISLNSDIGITLTSKNKGDFSNAFEILKNIIIG
ncbi:hypothetical protein [Bacillus inaquosorum]|uniref:hypothetical protein n=1 Tax=Bacillus inaquosorum TaxID=483913 RepID=UPI00227F35E5|nr:hypothetical protein [Bacillus inaquosorum]MCY9028890.1 hypothetical protein [Bacillus inaquosorum]